jgi:enoyl-CoA hydratase
VGDELLVTADGPVRVVTLNRPDDLNIIDRTLHQRLLDVWRELDRDPDARCVVLTGAGRAFSGGGDFAFLKAQHQSLDLRYEISHEAGAILRAMTDFRLPVVAAVNGPAVGLGASLVLSCDLVLMTERSYLCDPHVSIGLTAGDGGALLWPHMMSLIRAKEYVYTGERIPAAKAVELGLANRVTSGETLMDEALALAGKLAGQPARALQTTKRAFSKHIAQSAVAIIDYGLAAETVELGAEEHITKIREFLGSDEYDAIVVDQARMDPSE